MRATLAIDDDVLPAAKHLAEREQKTIGAVISSLASLGLASRSGGLRTERNGIPLLPHGKNASPVTLEQVNQLRDERP